VRKIVTLLSKCADRAVFHDWIAADPVAGVRSPRSTPPRPKALTEQQIDALLAEVDDHWFLLTAFLAATPVRPGEALGLEVRHLDPERNLVRIEQQWSERNGGELKQRTKTNASTRWTPVQASLMVELVAATAGCAPTDPVFVTETARRVSLANYNKRVLAPAARRAGIGTITAYVLRHTAVTHVVERNHGKYHRKEIASWCGHSDRTLADVYLRVGADFSGDEMDAMPDLVARRRGARDNVVPINRSAQG
jgi:integrase